MKQSFMVGLFSAIIIMTACQKDEKIPQPLNSNSLASTSISAGTLAEGVDEASGFMSDSYLANNDLDHGGPGLYWSPMEPLPVGHVNYYYGKIEITAKYRTRNLRPIVTIFYQYDYDRTKGRIYKIGAPEQGEGEGQLSFIGTSGEIDGAYVNGGINAVTARNPSETLIADGNAVYGANEKRTIVVSVNGGIKVLFGFKAAELEIGSELEQGFTIQRATNETGFHSGDVAYTIKVPVSGWTQFYPVFQRSVNIKGAFYGTIRD
ncbi:hypothetical protein [Chitinophaga pinensis]|uniref:Lipoprotein n=1 Tax=Chitinophaga pinensis (strain ATCC 43595 / DSM 2588 / LMG 13176 / NBRC 15968 / NCIMB 11800 / UQM 2034) TaxID=485918 RepID=A0A979G3I9_CHIPD|nr:hypothetical protein [Chitinophaga pinensis]ACU60038.1 hypothetical protein Cpin_2555 [Chitinophaga pinensis DSM 2588]